jgi:hypothetical protein
LEVKLFWRENYFGGKIILAGKLFWRENYFGGKIILAGKLFWRENYFGGKIILAGKCLVRKLFFSTVEKESRKRGERAKYKLNFERFGFEDKRF